jgi:hypothetical protein
MSTKEKLKERFLRFPKDFTFDELVRLLGNLGFVLQNKGDTSGSRIAFVKEEDKIIMHRPHPDNIVKVGVLKCLYVELNTRGLL